jgi:hypothetical protein
VTFEERRRRQLVVYARPLSLEEALDAAIASGSTCGFGETFEQLDELLSPWAGAWGIMEVVDLACSGRDSFSDESMPNAKFGCAHYWAVSD